ncbi:MAG: HAMP domain-containing protein [Rhodospirillales bacterium]|nr:HAMP domain-containing protein [Rhodospirillales bacterium]
MGLAVVQGVGLTIHALDSIDLQHLAEARNVGIRVMGLYRAVVTSPPPQRARIVEEFGHAPDFQGSLSAGPPTAALPPAVPPIQRLVRLSLNLMPLPRFLHPREVRVLGGPEFNRLAVGLMLPGGDTWLDITLDLHPPRPWHSPTFLIAFLLMSVTAAALTIWAVRRLTAPVATLAAAAEALGRDVNAPPLPEDGPSEIATAAQAFNTMASRIRRFVQDRTELLTAIGHDLRTPITRLKLRAEFMEDDEQRRKMLLDLEELEAMVSATLAFGRDVKGSEPVSPLDLAELLRTILDEAGDAWPDAAEKLAYQGPAHQIVRARPLSLKRALANLVSNAVHYAGGARVRLGLAADGASVNIEVEDDGPGIPPQELDRVFEPFHRLEASRNRETGGVGLGLPIARNILRAHGGDITLANRPGGGTKASVSLPI